MGASYENVNDKNTNSFMRGWGADGGQNFYDYTRSAMASSGVMDPTTFATQFLQGAPGMIDLAMNVNSPLVGALDQYAGAVAPESARAAEGAYSAENSFYSSGALDAGRRASSDIFLQAQVNKTNAQTQMAGNMLGILGSGLSASRGQTAGLLGQMLGIGGDMATPVMQKKDPVGDALGIGISALGAVSGILAAPATGGLSLLALGGLGQNTKRQPDNNGGSINLSSGMPYYG